MVQDNTKRITPDQDPVDMKTVRMRVNCQTSLLQFTPFDSECQTVLDLTNSITDSTGIEGITNAFDVLFKRFCILGAFVQSSRPLSELAPGDQLRMEERSHPRESRSVSATLERHGMAILAVERSITCSPSILAARSVTHDMEWLGGLIGNAMAIHRLQ
jgi:hypothetical protein